MQFSLFSYYFVSFRPKYCLQPPHPFQSLCEGQFTGATPRSAVTHKRVTNQHGYSLVRSVNRDVAHPAHPTQKRIKVNHTVTY